MCWSGSQHCSQSLPHMHQQRWDLAWIWTGNHLHRRRTRYHSASDPAFISLKSWKVLAKISEKNKKWVICTYNDRTHCLATCSYHRTDLDGQEVVVDTYKVLHINYIRNITPYQTQRLAPQNTGVLSSTTVEHNSKTVRLSRNHFLIHCQTSQ